MTGDGESNDDGDRGFADPAVVTFASLINGAALTAAVAMSSWAQRLRVSRFRAKQLRQLAHDDLGHRDEGTMPVR